MIRSVRNSVQRPWIERREATQTVAADHQQSMRFEVVPNSVRVDVTTVKLGTFESLQRFNNVVITRSGENIDVQGWTPDVGVLKAMQRVEIRVSGHEVTVHPFGPKSFVDTKITYGGNHVTVQAFGDRLNRADITKRARRSGSSTSGRASSPRSAASAA